MLFKVIVMSLYFMNLKMIFTIEIYFFLNQIMDISLRSTNIAGEAAGSDIIKGMYIQAVADKSSGSLGISNMLYEFLSKNNK